MNKKDKCRAILLQLFGPASAKQVDNMDEATVVSQCYEKVKAFFGLDRANELFKDLL